MGPQARREYIRQMARRYGRAQTRRQKKGIVDEVMANTGYHRKSVIRVLNAQPARTRRRPRRPRLRRYDAAVVTALLVVWRAADYACAPLLHAALPQLLPRLQRDGHLALTAGTERLLQQMSRSTMERALAPHRHLRPAGRYTPRRAGRSALARSIPLEVLPEPALRVGSIDTDTVQHDGGDPRGTFASTVNCIDRATYWSAKQAVYGRRHDRVLAGLRRARQRMPMTWARLHFDGGGEFVNQRLVHWSRAHGVDPTIGRPYRSNDNARVENRNRYQIRRRVGRIRIDEPTRIALLNQIWDIEDCYHNFFHPVKKLVSTTTFVSDGIRRRLKTYDTPQTPYARVLVDPHVPRRIKRGLRAQYAKLDPVALLDQLYALTKKL